MVPYCLTLPREFLKSSRPYPPRQELAIRAFILGLIAFTIHAYPKNQSIAAEVNAKASRA